MPVGILTAAGRDEWAAARGALESASPLNVASLQAIDEALFVVTLDPSSPGDAASLSRAMLHGRGFDRW